MGNNDIERLIEYTAELWKRSGKQNINYEKLKDDPVTRLLLGAVAHQTSQLSNEISAFRQDVATELIGRYPSQYGLQAVPAVGMLQVEKPQKKGSVDESPTHIDEKSVFVGKRDGVEISFLPLLSISVFDLKVCSVSPVGKNRWSVDLDGTELVKDLLGLSLYLPNIHCKRMNIYVGSRIIEVCNISDFDQLPFVTWFKDMYQLPTLLNVYDRLCCETNCYGVIDQSVLGKDVAWQGDHISFEIELIGAPEGTTLSPDSIMLNCVPICNMEVHNLSLNAPDRGMSEDKYRNAKVSAQMIKINKTEHFLGLSSITLPPGKIDYVSVREMGVSRMSEWKHRIEELMDYYDSDYCFIHNKTDEKFDKLSEAFKSALQDIVLEDGIYVVSRDHKKLFSESLSSVELSWFSTYGEESNGMEEGSKFECPITPTLVNTLVSHTYGGRNPITCQEERKAVLQYQMQSGDRIVSKSDIRIFCLRKLAELYNVSIEEVGIRLKNEVIKYTNEFSERVLKIEILLPHVDIDHKSAEIALERMIQSRTAITTKMIISIRNKQ